MFQPEINTHWETLYPCPLEGGWVCCARNSQLLRDPKSESRKDNAPIKTHSHKSVTLNSSIFEQVDRIVIKLEIPVGMRDGGSGGLFH